MAKLSEEELEAIIRRELPGYRIVKGTVGEDAVASRVRADQGTPDLAALKEKLEGPRNPGLAEPGADPDPDGAPVSDSANTDTEMEPAFAVGDEDETPEDTMVAIEPDAPPNPWDHGARPKVVVVSGKDGKIVTSQG